MDTAIPGATVTYTVTIQNLSSSKTQNVVITDVMDSGLTMVDGSLKVVSGGVLVPGDPGDPVMVAITKNKTATVTYQATVGSDVVVGTKLKNTFTATVEGTTKSDSDSHTVTVKDPDSYTVTYHYIDADGTETKVDGAPVTDPSTVNLAQKVTYPETDGKTYALDKVDVNETAKTVDVYYELDAYGPTSDTDPTKGGPDGIPDKYQAVVTYKVSGGTWDGTENADKEYVFTLKEKDTNGEWKDISGVTLGNTVPNTDNATADEPAYTDEGAGWKDTTPVSTISVTGNVTYIYAFKPKDATVTYPEVEDGKLPDPDPKDDADPKPEDTTDNVDSGVTIIVDPNGGNWNGKQVLMES